MTHDDAFLRAIIERPDYHVETRRLPPGRVMIGGVDFGPCRDVSVLYAARRDGRPRLIEDRRIPVRPESIDPPVS